MITFYNRFYVSAICTKTRIHFCETELLKIVSILVRMKMWKLNKINGFPRIYRKMVNKWIIKRKF